MNRWLVFWVAGVLAVSGAAAQQRVSVPSLDTQHGASVLLAGYWFVAELPGARPAVLMLHGCNGVHGQGGAMNPRLRDYATWLNEEGWHVLVLDSYSVRGLSQVCTKQAAARNVTLARRRHDALGALQWLSEQPGVDATRLVLVGWSDGGGAVLAATNLNAPEVKEFAVVPRAAVAFYPACDASVRRGYEASAPLLLLLGERDDWTPPQLCHELVANALGEPVRQVTYHGAGHGFDAVVPAHRRDEPAEELVSKRPRAGAAAIVHAASHARFLSFLHQYLDE